MIISAKIIFVCLSWEYLRILPFLLMYILLIKNRVFGIGILKIKQWLSFT